MSTSSLPPQAETATSGNRIHRFQDGESLAVAVAEKLLAELATLSAIQEVVNIGLTGGRIATEIYRHIGAKISQYEIDLAKINLWFTDERFVAATSEERNSQQALAPLAEVIAQSAAQIHLMPAPNQKNDVDLAALSYSQELGDTVMDICLLSMGPDGHIGSIFPNHPSFKPETDRSVIGVTNSPKPPSERISMTIPAINRSKNIWMLVVGEEKAEAARMAILADETIPAAWIKATEQTRWFLDLAAARRLPYYGCDF